MGVWQEEKKFVPAYGTSYDYFGYDVAPSGDTSIIGSPLGDYTGSEIGSVYVFSRWDDGIWEEVQKSTPKIRRLVIGLDLGWPYPVTLLSLEP